MTQDWFPVGLPDDVKDRISAAHPDDPHMAAAMAWEAWAATLAASGDAPLSGVTSVSTGSQSVSYGGRGHGAIASALDRASWHRSRARVYSVPVGPTFRGGNRVIDTRPVWVRYRSDVTM
jgi:hypothetical protein